MIRNIFLALALATSLTSCQDLADTYSDYAGDGEIRYIGMCNDLKAAPGWEHLVVSWKDNVDPVIDKIKLKWSSISSADSVLLDRGTETYDIKNLADNTYEIEICSLDKDGNPSMSNSVYARPYTNSHEEVLAFSRIIAKHYIIGDNVILQFSDWQDGIESAVLKYTTTDGTEEELNIDESLTWDGLYPIEESIDVSKPITLYRTGRIGDCPDLIEFEPYVLGTQKTYTSDFKNFIRTKYGVGSVQMPTDGIISETWANNVKTLEIDADMGSFEDVLNFPNLEKLILGKNTYLTSAGAEDPARGQYKVYDPGTSDYAFEILNGYTGLEVERYNKHYNTLPISAMWYYQDMGPAELPTLKCIDMSKAKITMAPEDKNGYNSHLDFLIDNNVQSCWKPITSTDAINYTITIDLGKEEIASGVKLVQKAFSEYDQDNDIAPQSISVEYADKNSVYHDATFEHNNYIGTSTGQTILLPFAGGKKTVRYLRLTIPAQYYNNFYEVTLAEVGLYK